MDKKGRILLTHGIVGRGGDAIQVECIEEAFSQLGYEVCRVGAHPIQPYYFTGPSDTLRHFARGLPWWTRDAMEVASHLWILRQVRSSLRRHNALILHRAAIYDLAGSQLAERANCPFVAHLDAPFVLERAFRGERALMGLHRHCMRRLGRVATTIVTVSAAAKAYFVELGIPEAKILVLPNGISSRFLHLGRELAEEHPPLQRTERISTIGFVGSLSRWHRIDLLLEALRLLRVEDGDSWRLRVVGFGQESQTARRRAVELGLEGSIDWLGPEPHEEAFKRLGEFDIVVLPNTLPTGAPLKLFEYAATARPMVIPDLPNLRSLFTDKEVRFVPPGDPRALADAFRGLRSCPEEAREMGRLAQARVQELTWTRWAERVLKSVVPVA